MSPTPASSLARALHVQRPPSAARGGRRASAPAPARVPAGSCSIVCSRKLRELARAAAARRRRRPPGSPRPPGRGRRRRAGARASGAAWRRAIASRAATLSTSSSDALNIAQASSMLGAERETLARGPCSCTVATLVSATSYGVRAADAAALRVHLHHDPVGLGRPLVEDRLEHLHDELHRRVVVVEQDDVEELRPLRDGLRLLLDLPRRAFSRRSHHINCSRRPAGEVRPAVAVNNFRRRTARQREGDSERRRTLREEGRAALTNGPG